MSAHDEARAGVRAAGRDVVRLRFQPHEAEPAAARPRFRGRQQVLADSLPPARAIDREFRDLGHPVPAFGDCDESREAPARGRAEQRGAAARLARPAGRVEAVVLASHGQRAQVEQVAVRRIQFPRDLEREVASVQFVGGQIDRLFDADMLGSVHVSVSCLEWLRSHNPSPRGAVQRPIMRDIGADPAARWLSPSDWDLSTVLHAPVEECKEESE
ncbi:hypothetical protein EMIT0158MI4_230022 [Burkholderia ambifaria]